jgi:hypothetical protein
VGQDANATCAIDNPEVRLPKPTIRENSLALAGGARFLRAAHSGEMAEWLKAAVC